MTTPAVALTELSYLIAFKHFSTIYENSRSTRRAAEVAEAAEEAEEEAAEEDWRRSQPVSQLARSCVVGGLHHDDDIQFP